LLGSPGFEEKSGSLYPVVAFRSVEVERVQRLMAVANPLKDGVQAVSTV